MGQEDLSKKIQALFKVGSNHSFTRVRSPKICGQVLDVDLGGSLSYKELSIGLRKIHFSTPVHLSRSHCYDSN
jgi:hypothetical protein